MRLISLCVRKFTAAFCGLALLAGATNARAADLPLQTIEMPEGFKIDVYAEVPDARSIKLSDSGVLFVSSREEPGSVRAVLDHDNDYQADEVVTIDTGLRMPNGIVLRDGDLYVAEVSRIWRYPDIEANLQDPPEPELIYDDLPTDGHHGWKFMALGPDDRLYFNIGAPCNICNKEDEDPRYATISSIAPDGTDFRIDQRGVRNSVGITWHPETQNMWFTDNGRDWMGDNQPPCELNRATEHDQHFGYPYWHGTSLPDPEFGEGHSADEFTLPVQDLGPHVAPLGLEFYTGDMFPEEYRNQVFIAERGSWNRTIPIGYRVTLVRLDGAGNATSYEDFAAGWLRRTKAWGRVVDLEGMPDGSMLVSDDTAGVIYRITYEAPDMQAK